MSLRSIILIIQSRLLNILATIQHAEKNVITFLITKIDVIKFFSCHITAVESTIISLCQPNQKQPSHFAHKTSRMCLENNPKRIHIQ